MVSYIAQVIEIQADNQSALFNFQSLLLVLLLLICTCTYVRGSAPGLVDRNREGQVILPLSLYHSEVIHMIDLDERIRKEME